MEFVELEKNIPPRRTVNSSDLLNAIRNRSATDDDLALLNRRVDPEFSAPPDDFFICLTSTNEQANRINDEQIAMLKGKTYTFYGLVEGDFGKEYLPTQVELEAQKRRADHASQQ